MTGEDLHRTEQLATTQERLVTLHRALSDAVDKLSQLYNSVQTGAGAHDEEYSIRCQNPAYPHAAPNREGPGICARPEGERRLIARQP